MSAERWKLNAATELVVVEVASLKREAVQLLAQISAEFQSDPMSVQCFDLRIVERAKYVTARMEELKRTHAGWLP